jgi:hypothetical protein
MDRDDERRKFQENGNAPEHDLKSQENESEERWNENPFLFSIANGGY